MMVTAIRMPVGGPADFMPRESLAFQALIRRAECTKFNHRMSGPY
jgi:hypothetical protein